MKLITVDILANGVRSVFYKHMTDIKTHHAIVRLRKFGAKLKLESNNVCRTVEKIIDNKRTFLYLVDHKNAVRVEVKDVI